MREIRIPGLRRVVRAGGRHSLRDDVDEEIRFHLEARASELEAAGMSAADARRRAAEEFGDVTAGARELLAIDRRRQGHAQREELLMSTFDDLRYATRALLRRPALLALTTSILCLGIAANAVMFGVVDQLLLQPPAQVGAPEQLRRIYFHENGGSQPVTNYPLVLSLQQQANAFEGVSAFWRTSASLGRGVDARSVDVQLVSGNYFNLLRLRPALGRAFAPDEDTIPVGAPVAVVSHRFWQRELGGEAEAIGRRLEVAGKSVTVIGVAPAGFSGIDRLNTDLWLPVSALAADLFSDNWRTEPGNWWVQTFARVRDVSGVALAETQATSIFRAQLRELNRKWRDSTGSVVLGSIIGTRTPGGVSDEARVSLWVLGVSAIVLLIACANVANLLIARTVERRREIAVRLALGVSRSRLIRMLLTEAGLLAAIATVAALLVTWWGSRVVQQLLLPEVTWNEAPVDGRVLAFTVAVAVACILVAGMAPAWQSLRLRVSEGLKEGARQVAGQRGRMRQALLVMQAALSVMLLVGASLFVRSLRNVAGTDVGIDLDRVVRVNMNLARAGFDRAQAAEIFRRAHERVRELPGVQHAALVGGSVPMQMGQSIGFRIPGIAKLPELENGGPYGTYASADYLTTLGTRMLRGRNFTDDESRVPSRVMIINETLAQSWFRDRDPVGQCVMTTGDSTCTTIVGVASNVMLFQMVRDPRSLVYVPFTHPRAAGESPTAMVLRVSGDPSTVIPMVRREIQQLAPNMPHVNVRTFADLVAPQLRPWRLGATMFSLFGGIALLIAAVGLYSVMAYWVAQRTHEIGVRMALGAGRGQIVRLVGCQTARGVLAGIVLGVAAAVAASRFVAGMLYETSPRDPVAYATAAGVLLVAGLVAAIVPVRRSTAVEPVAALKAE